MEEQAEVLTAVAEFELRTVTNASVSSEDKYDEPSEKALTFCAITPSTKGKAAEPVCPILYSRVSDFVRLRRAFHGCSYLATQPIVPVNSLSRT